MLSYSRHPSPSASVQPVWRRAVCSHGCSSCPIARSTHGTRSCWSTSASVGRRYGLFIGEPCHFAVSNVAWTGQNFPATRLTTRASRSKSSCSGSKREEWSYFRATSDQSARSVSSLAIDCLRSPSPSCFFHQRFVNWHVKGRTKRNHPGWSRRGTSGISQAPHQNWLAESPVGKPRRTGYMLISFYHRRMALKEV